MGKQHNWISDCRNWQRPGLAVEKEATPDFIQPPADFIHPPPDIIHPPRDLTSSATITVESNRYSRIPTGNASRSCFQSVDGSRNKKKT